MWKGPAHCRWCHPWAGFVGEIGRASHGKQHRKQHSSIVSAKISVLNYDWDMYDCPLQLVLASVLSEQDRRSGIPLSAWLREQRPHSQVFVSLTELLKGGLVGCWRSRAGDSVLGRLAHRHNLPSDHHLDRNITQGEGLWCLNFQNSFLSA